MEDKRIQVNYKKLWKMFIDMIHKAELKERKRK